MTGLRRALDTRCRDLYYLALVLLDTLLLWLGIYGSRPSGAVPTVAIVALQGCGDLLLAAGFLRAVRRKYPAPDYRLILLCSPESQELVRHVVDVDELLVINRHAYIRSIAYRIEITRRVRAHAPTVVFQPALNRYLAVEDSLVRLSGAKERSGNRGDAVYLAGLSRWLSDRWYDRLVDSPASNHELTRYRALGAALGLPESDGPAFSVPAPAKGPYLLCAVTTSAPLKSWPQDRFFEAARAIASERAWRIIVVGSGPATTPIPEDMVDLRNRTTMDELIGLVQHACLVLTGDSFPMHLAAFCHTPAVAVAGGGLPDRYHPYPDDRPMAIVTHAMPCFGCRWRCIYILADSSPAPCVMETAVSSVVTAARSLLAARCNSAQSAGTTASTE